MSRGARLGSWLGPPLVTLALLAAVEGGLRLWGFQQSIAIGGDPKANLVPLFKRATAPDGTPVWERPDAPVRFVRDKPANGLRIFVLGESPVVGFPFGPALSFSRFLADRLTAAFPDRTVEVVNAGVNGVGSWHVRRLVEEEIVRHAPDVVVIYTGHGDWVTPPPIDVPWLQRTIANLRLYQLAAATSARWRQARYGQFDAGRLKALNDPFGYGRQRARGQLTLTRAEAATIVDRFAQNLRAMVRAAQDAGARVVLATVGQNLAGFPPGASRHRPGISDAAVQRWSALTADGLREAGAGNCGAAVTAFDAAIHLDPRPALTWYERARCLEALGRFGHARAGYRIASDRDEVPLGARSPSNDAIRAVAAETGVPLVEVAGALAAASMHGLVGSRLFFDHAHPTFAGHIAIARTLARALGAPDGTWPDPRDIEAQHPDLMKQALIGGNVLIYIMLGWYDVAHRTVDENARRFPDVTREGIASLHEGIASLERADPGRPRLEFPRAPD